MLTSGRQKLLELYTRYEVRFDVLFFVAGFIFDVVLATEIDDPLSLVQQIVYLFVIASFIHHEILFGKQLWAPTGTFITKIWNYRNLVMHFLLGSLLNLYSLFYIKSASFLSTIIFVTLMVAIVVANELPAVKKAGVQFKVGLFAICLFSFVAVIFPVLLGFVGWSTFILSVVSTCGLIYLQWRLLKRSVRENRILMESIMLPSFSVLVVFVVFYVLGWIPPVPLSVKEQGIYHLVEKKDGNYLLSTESASWKFWLSGDQDFKAQPNDKIYFYSQVYSPARFSDQIFIQWLFKDPVRGWQKTDRIPLQITGGRKEGFRGFVSKSNFQPGEWRVQVETGMGHEISRLGFEVSNAVSSESRTFRIITR